jgi:glycosyltransferase involved in cell wall biosynthesis
MPRTILINATSIGRSVDGIGTYGTHLVRAICARPVGDLRFDIVLSAASRIHFKGMDVPPHVRLCWVTSAVSPDGGTRGHFLRWIHGSLVGARHPRSLVFSTSPIAAPLVGGPTVVMVHDLIPLLFPRYHPRQRVFYRTMLGPALRRAAALLTPSTRTKEDLQEHYGLDPARIHVVPHGPTVPVAPSAVRRPDASVRTPDGTPFILCLGRRSPMKNVQALVQAYALLRDRVPERLVIAGAAPDLPTVAPPGVTYVDEVPEAMKQDLLDRASVLVCPTLYEGFGLIPLEAMSRGCPVVVSRVGSLPEVCGDAAQYFDPGDVPGIAEATLRVLRDPELRGRMAVDGLRRARSHSWERSVARHVAVFEEALAGRPVVLPAAARAAR